MVTHSSILVWRIPWTEETGGLQSMGLQRVGHNWVTKHSIEHRLKQICINQNGNYFNEHIFASERWIGLFLKHKNPCFRIQWTLGRHFLPPAGCGSLPCKKVVEVLEEVVVGWWEIRWMWWMRPTLEPNLFNFWSIGCATCSRTLFWRSTGPFLLTSAGCRHGSFWCSSSICWAYFSDVLVSLGLRKM